MQTRRQWLYQVRERLRATSPDVRLPNRLIARELEQALRLLLRRDADSRKIWKQTGLFTEQVISFLPDGPTRSRSVTSLPEVFHHALGPFLQIIPTDGTPWVVSTPKQLAGKRGYYAWLDGENYLVLGQGGISEIPVRYYHQPGRTNPCQSELDVLLPVPDHLEEDLKNTTVQKLAAAPLPIPDDTYPNQNPLDKQGPRTATPQTGQ